MERDGRAMVARRQTDSNRASRVAARIINMGALFPVEMSPRPLPLIDFPRICRRVPPLRTNTWIYRQETPIPRLFTRARPESARAIQVARAANYSARADPTDPLFAKQCR